ncbi:hypothetical protein WMY93_031333 [Mugilogobius chulae]|uniref:Regulator of microtubule dynamics protein 1 n=1 Tax=Mugilogobius chulae TaxID=88201 RepID=A0AAW0MFU8_9GOBI
MAGTAAFTLCRTALSVFRRKNIHTRAFYYWSAARRTTNAFKSARSSFLLGVPALFLLGHELHRRVQQSASVFALDRVEVLEQADYLHSCAEAEKLYQLLCSTKTTETTLSSCGVTLVPLVILLFCPTPRPTKKKELVYEAFESAKAALEKDEKCFAAHKWYAICLSDVGEYEGIKVKLGNSYIIRDHLLRAIELNPKDATSMYILGYWCFSFAELPWYQRKVAAVIFGTPPTSTYEEALEYFLRAEEADPNFYSKNLFMLGQTYLRMNDKDKAKVWLTKAKEYPPLTHEDKETQKEAEDLLKKLG